MWCSERCRSVLDCIGLCCVLLSYILPVYSVQPSLPNHLCPAVSRQPSLSSHLSAVISLQPSLPGHLWPAMVPAISVQPSLLSHLSTAISVNVTVTRTTTQRRPRPTQETVPGMAGQITPNTAHGKIRILKKYALVKIAHRIVFGTTQ